MYRIKPRLDCLSPPLLLVAGLEETTFAARPRRADAWKDAGQSRDEQFAAKRAALIRKAARAFSARGFYNTSLDDIAAELGVTKPGSLLLHQEQGRDPLRLPPNFK